MTQIRSVRPDPTTAQVFTTLAEAVYGTRDYELVHDAICAAAPLLVSGCDHASVMLRRGTTLVNSGASDAVARQVDGLERSLGEGPCVDAINEDSVYIDGDLTNGSPWPRLAEYVLAETPVRGMAGFRLAIGPDHVGALDLFSDEPGALTEQSVHEGIVLASFVSVALYAAHQQHKADTLREGLESNREIGKAVGLMMAFHKVSDDEAFAMLRKASQDMNMKVTDVAREVVEHHNVRGYDGIA